MTPQLWAALIAQVGIPAAEYVFKRMNNPNPITDEDWKQLRDLKSFDELYREATGQDAPTS